MSFPYSLIARVIVVSPAILAVIYLFTA